MARKEKTKSIAVINDLSSFGKCSLTVALPLLTYFNIQVCPLPTAVLSCQTGFENYHIHDLTEDWDKYFESWRSLNINFDGILSGFLTGAEQAKKVMEFLAKFKSPNTLVVVDPVLGDGGKKFDTVNDDLVQQMKRLVYLADVATPNLTEFCLLLDLDYSKIAIQEGESDFFEQMYQHCKVLFDKGCKSVVVTGIKRNGWVFNLIAQQDGFSLTKSEYFGVNISGSGDIFSSILSAKMLKGYDVITAAKYADKFLTKAIKDTVKEKFDRNHGINFEKFLSSL